MDSSGGGPTSGGRTGTSGDGPTSGMSGRIGSEGVPGSGLAGMISLLIGVTFNEGEDGALVLLGPFVLMVVLPVAVRGLLATYPSVPKVDLTTMCWRVMTIKRHAGVLWGYLANGCLRHPSLVTIQVHALNLSTGRAFRANHGFGCIPCPKLGLGSIPIT